MNSPKRAPMVTATSTASASSGADACPTEYALFVPSTTASSVSPTNAAPGVCGYETMPALLELADSFGLKQIRKCKTVFSDTDVSGRSNLTHISTIQLPTRQQPLGVMSATVAKGAFAKIKLLRMHEDGSLYAVRMNRLSPQRLPRPMVAATQTGGALRPKSVQECTNAVVYGQERMMLARARSVIAPVFSFFDEKSRIYDVLPLFDGDMWAFTAESLQDSIDPGALIWTAKSMLQSLVVLESAGIVHRDIKPENMFYRRDARVVLGDYGMAQNIHQFRFGGTSGYIAPETFSLEAGPTPGSDLFSLGMSLVYMAVKERGWHEFPLNIESKSLKAVATVADADFDTQVEILIKTDATHQAYRNWQRFHKARENEHLADVYGYADGVDEIELLFRDMHSFHPVLANFVFEGLLQTDWRQRGTAAGQLQALEGLFPAGHAIFNDTPEVFMDAALRSSFAQRVAERGEQLEEADRVLLQSAG